MATKDKLYDPAVNYDSGSDNELNNDMGWISPSSSPPNNSCLEDVFIYNRLGGPQSDRNPDNSTDKLLSGVATASGKKTLRCLGKKCPNKGITDELWDGNKYECSKNKSHWATEHGGRRWHNVHRFCWDCANNTKQRSTCPGDGCMSAPIDRPGRQPKEI